MLDLRNTDVGALDDDDIDLPKKIIDSKDKIDFHGFESLYKKFFDIKYQLFCSTVQIKSQESFDDLKKLFEIIQAKVAVVLKSTCKKTRLCVRLQFTTCYIEISKIYSEIFGLYIEIAEIYSEILNFTMKSLKFTLRS